MKWREHTTRSQVFQHADSAPAAGQPGHAAVERCSEALVRGQDDLLELFLLTRAEWSPRSVAKGVALRRNAWHMDLHLVVHRVQTKPRTFGDEDAARFVFKDGEERIARVFGPALQVGRDCGREKKW